MADPIPSPDELKRLLTPAPVDTRRHFQQMGQDGRALSELGGRLAPARPHRYFQAKLRMVPRGHCRYPLHLRQLLIYDDSGQLASGPVVTFGGAGDTPRQAGKVLS